MRLTKTDNTLIGRVVRYVEHAGDDNLRFSDHWYNNEDGRSSIPEIPIGSIGIVVALHYHEGISSCGSTQQDKNEDRWIEVDFGDDKEYFWREELELVHPTPEDAVSSNQTLSTSQNEDGCLLITPMTVILPCPSKKSICLMRKNEIPAIGGHRAQLI